MLQNEESEGKSVLRNGLQFAKGNKQEFRQSEQLLLFLKQAISNQIEKNYEIDGIAKTAGIDKFIPHFACPSHHFRLNHLQSYLFSVLIDKFRELFHSQVCVAIDFVG